MSQMSYYYLILRYPPLRVYINKAYTQNRHDEFFDFLINLDTSNVEVRRG